MTTPLVVNGATFLFPTDGDPAGWGDVVTSWATAITNGTFPKTGGDFTLTGEVDFGPNYGIKMATLTMHSTEPVASTGSIKMPRTATVVWRNEQNNGNIALGINTLNQLCINGVPISTGGAGDIPGGAGQLLASDGAGNFYNVPYGSVGKILASTGSGTTWVDQGDIQVPGTIGVGSGLPATGTTGEYFYNETDGLLYHWDGEKWTPAVPAVVISGQLTSGQIEDSAITAVKLANAAVTAAKTDIAALSPLTGLLNPNTVDNAQLVNNAINSLKLADGAVTANKTALAALSPLTGLLNANTVSTEQLVNGAVNNLKILDGAITANKTAIAALDNTTGQLAANTVAAAQLVAGAVTDVALASGAVTAAKTAIAAINPSSGNLSANSVTTNSIQAGSIVSDKIAANAVVADKIAAGSIVTSKIAAGAITANEIGANAVTAAKVAAGAITAGKIAAGAVTANELAAGSVTTDALAANSVVAGKIAAGAVLASSIDAGAITSDKIYAGAVTADALAANSVVAGKIAAAAVDASAIQAGAVVAGKIAAGSIGTNELSAGSITASKLAVLVGSGNQAPNSSFEYLITGNRPGGWAQLNSAGISTTYTRPSGRATGTFGFGLLANANSTGTFGAASSDTYDTTSSAVGGLADGWIANTTYMVSFYARKVNGAGWSTMTLPFTPAQTVEAVSNPALTTSYQRYVFRVTIGATAPANGLIRMSVVGATASGDELNIDDVQVEQGDVVTGWSPRPNEILPGTIVGNMIAAQTILGDNIAANTISGGNILANTITGGLIQAGAITSTKIAAGTITGDRIAANTITASNIDSKGLTIKDNAGNVILGVGTPLVPAYADAALKNSSITLNANGTISGAGGGQVTVAGLDNTIIRSANPITAGNVSTYIANAAIGSAQVGVLYANNIAAGAITADKMAVGTITAASGVIANLAVTNLKIAGSAVSTDKVQSYAITEPAIATGPTTITVSTSATTMATLGFTSTGGTLALDFGCMFKSKATGGSGPNADGWLALVTLTISVRRNGTEIFNSGAMLPSYHYDGGTVTTGYTATRLPPIYDNPGAGTYTYTIVGYTNSTIGCYAYARNLSIVEYKR